MAIKWLPASIAIGRALALSAWFFSLTPTAHRLENRYGLGLLYGLRGPLPAPEHAVVVAIDRKTINWLRQIGDSPSSDSGRLRACMPPDVYAGLGKIRGPTSLPRSVYGCLIRELTRLGFPVVVMDVLFAVPGDEVDDESLAAAIREHSAVVLLAGLERSTFEEHQVQPIGKFGEHAVATGAFIVSRTEGPVYGYWRKFPGFEEMQSLPDVAFHLHLQSEPTDQAEMPLFEYFWLYGPPGSVAALSVRDILSGEVPEDLRAAARTSTAFVGASDPDMTNFADTFPSFLDSGNDSNLSGVELAATAFLNLTTNQRLRRLPPTAETMVIVLFAFCLGFLVRVRWRYAMLVAPSAAFLYLAVAAFAFSSAGLFLPIVTPVFVVVPIAFVLAGLARYRFARTLLTRIAPAPVARRMLARATDQRAKAVSDEATVVFFDLAGSSAIAEKMSAVDYSELLNSYHETVKASVEDHRGLIVAFAGDGVMAAFTRSAAGADHASRACRSALRIVGGIQTINASRRAGGLPPLHIRVGINTGRVAEAEIGAQDRFNFSVVGDVVNLASRFEQLGKSLFPEQEEVILVGEATHGLTSASDFSFEDCGVQQIHGRQRSERVYRLCYPSV